jgi:hypothetical protein
VPRVVGDIFKAMGPVVTATGENLDCLVGEMDLHPVAIELDLVNPPVPGRSSFDRSCQLRFDKAGKLGLDADRLRLPLKRHD